MNGGTERKLKTEKKKRENTHRSSKDTLMLVHDSVFILKSQDKRE